MSTSPAALSLVPPTSQALITQLAVTLSTIKADLEQTKDSKTWTLADAYVTAYQDIAQLMTAEGERPTPQRVNKAIKRQPGYTGPGASWLSDAKRTADTFTGLFRAGMNNPLSYDTYRQIAVCQLKDARKAELRIWMETGKVTRADLRISIRHEVDGLPNTGFKITRDNLWHFNEPTQSDFDGGIHPLIVANLLYYFSDPHSVIVDPMAGGDTTAKVIGQYPYFQKALPSVDGSGPRTIYRSDLHPTTSGIIQADATKQLPWSDELADFCLFDPPYFLVANGKYGTLGSTIEEWKTSISLVAREIWRVLKPGGKVAVIVDDYVRSGFQPLSRFAARAFEDVGFTDAAVIYSAHRNYLSLSPAEQQRYQRKKLLLNGVKIISVFTKPQD